MSPRRPRLLLGAGNVLRRDDGVGVFVVRAAERLRMSARVDIHDAGSGAIGLAEVLELRERVVVVDAVDAGVPPGSVLRMRAEDACPAFRTGVSLHGFHLLDALAELRLLGTAPRFVALIAVQVGDVSPGVGLTRDVRRAVPAALRQALRALGLRAVSGFSLREPAPSRAGWACGPSAREECEPWRSL